MVWEGLMFKNIPDTDPLFEWGRFYTRYVSEIESDPVGDFSRTRMVFKVKFSIVYFLYYWIPAVKKYSWLTKKADTRTDYSMI